MITHILYASLSASLLWLFYKIVLEGETMHRFKRVFLLLIFPLSWLIPFISFPENPSIAPGIVFMGKSVRVEEGTKYISQVIAGKDSKSNLLLTIYGSIVLLLLSRFLFNLYSMLRAVRKGSVIQLNGQKTVLVKGLASPYSFGNTLFIGKDHYEKGIEPEILAHEQAHMKERHSWDIVLAELIIITNWFNPFAWFLKKSIQLNHEFLADRSVLKITDDISQYQYLLLNRSVQWPRQALSSQFNNPPLKKRIYMMLKNSPRWIIIVKQLMVVPMFFVLITLFSNRIIAQGKPFVSNNPFPAAKENAPQTILEQYKAILDKFKLDTRDGQKAFFDNITEAEKKQLVELYSQMSKEQQKQQLVGFMKRPKPLAPFHPTTTQFEKWKNASVYGVWLNDKKIKNSELSKYTDKDIAHFIVSKLYGKARSSVKYSYQVNLMTNEYYAKYVEDQKAVEQEPLMFIKWIEKEKK